MDSERQYEICEQWLADEQRVHERAEYGGNMHAVDAALREQTRRVRLVQDYEQKVNKAGKNAKDDEAKEKLSSAYDELRAVATHRQSCLQDMSQIATLEKSFNSLSMEFAQRATSLVAEACTGVSGSAEAPSNDDTKQRGESMGRTAQGCILAVRNNWNWISKLLKCSDVHLKHVSEYHQFFHQVKEYEEWMPSELQRCMNKLQSISETHDVHKLVLTIKEVVAVFLHWQGKMAALFESSGKIVPVHLRTSPVDHYRPMISLCDYTTSEISVLEGEELTLLDNSETQLWLVRNMHAVEAQLPSVICVIPGPDPDAVSAVSRLRIRLLGSWTMGVKTAGVSLMQYFLYVFKTWTDDQAFNLKNMGFDDKLRMRKVIKTIQDIFSKYWGTQEKYKLLDLRLNNTSALLVEEGDPRKSDKNFTREYRGHTKNIEEIILHFLNCLRQWETYKVLTETSRNSDYMLLVDSWQNLKYFSTSDVVRQAEETTSLFDEESVDGKFRSNQFKATTVTEIASETLDNVIISQDAPQLNTEVVTEIAEEESGSYGEGQIVETVTTTFTSQEIPQAGAGTAVDGTEESGSYSEGQTEETVTSVTSQEVSEVETDVAIETTENEESGSYGEGQTIETVTTSETVIDGQTTEEVVEEVAQTEQILHAEHEERKTFVITGVIDPRNGEEVSMQQAVLLGIINSQEGLYVNRRQGKSIPIPEAMNQGLIKVEFTTTRKTKEKRSDVGLMTIKTQKESRPYSIIGVIDAKTEEQITVDEAMKQGILDQKRGIYTNALLGEEMTLSDALDSGYLVAEFDKDAPEQSSEVVTKTYAIHGVVDQRASDKVSFAEAVRRGLLDKETGAYYHNVNNEYIFVGDAIKRGFIKASIVDDPSTIDIAPENKMVVEKVSTIKKKLVNPLKAVSAFRYAVDHPVSHEIQAGSNEMQTGSSGATNSEVMQTSGYSIVSQEMSFSSSSGADHVMSSSISGSFGTGSAESATRSDNLDEY